MPEEPASTRWVLPDPSALPQELAGQDLVGLGGDLEPGTLLAAYRSGIFPMHVAVEAEEDTSQENASDALTTREIGWWSPEPRGVLPLDRLVVSRSLRQSCGRLRTTVDRDFTAVVEGCATTRVEGQWIDTEIRAAYGRLYELGWAHSVETWEGDRLVGGLYGVGIGGLFAGESMFHRRTDASKVALVRLVDELSADGHERLLDIQWVTPHLASLGAEQVPRAEYLTRLAASLKAPAPGVWGTD